MARINSTFLISWLFTMLIVSSTAGFSQDDASRLRLLIHNFERDTVESLSDENIDIRPLLKTSFTRYDEIEILNNADFPDISVDRLHAETDSAYLEGIDAIVYGAYIVVNQYVRIEAVVFTTHDRLLHRVNSSRGTRAGLEGLVDEVRENVFETLLEIIPDLQKSIKRIAFVSDYETISGKYDNIGMMKNKSRALTLEIMQQMEYLGPTNTEVIPWKEVDEYLGNPSDEAIRLLDPDMFIRLTYVFSGEAVVALRTEFDIIEKERGRILKREFILPELRWDYYQSYDFQQYITNEMLAFLERIVSPAGQWDFIAFPNKSAIKTTNKDVLIYRAQNFATRSDFYLSTYHYYQAMEMFPEEVNMTELKLQIGFNKVYTERFEEAMLEFDYVLEKDPENHYAYLGKSLIAYYEGNSALALEYLEKANEKGAENVFLTEVLKGYYFYEMGNFKESIEAFGKALVAEQPTIKIRIINRLSADYLKIHIGLCYVGLGQYDQAINYYKGIKKDYPLNEDVDYYIGNAYSKKAREEYFQMNYAQAIDDFIEARKYFANSNVNDYLRTAYVYDKQLDEARQFITKEIEAGNYDSLFVWFEHAMDVRNLMINEHGKSGATTYDRDIGLEAIAVLKLNLRANPMDPASHFYIGELHALMGDLDVSLEYMEKAYALEELNFDTQLGLMYAHLLNGNYRECEQLERSLSRLYRRLNVPDRFTALMDYLYVSALLAQDKKAKKETRELEDLLKQDVVIDSWFYEPYLSWLEGCNCTEENRSYLRELTTKMQERNLN